MQFVESNKSDLLDAFDEDGLKSQRIVEPCGRDE